MEQGLRPGGPQVAWLVWGQRLAGAEWIPALPQRQGPIAAQLQYVNCITAYCQESNSKWRNIYKRTEAYRILLPLELWRTMTGTEWVLTLLTGVGVWLFFNTVCIYLSKLSGRARSIYAWIITFVLLEIGLGDITPGVVGYTVSSSDYLQFRPFLYAMMFLFTANYISAYMVTTNQDRDTRLAARIVRYGAQGLLIIAIGLWFHGIQGLTPAIRGQVFALIGVTASVGIVVNVILGSVLGRLPNSWIYGDSIVLDDRDKVGAKTILAAAVGFVAGYIGFSVGCGIGGYLVSSMGWATATEDFNYIFLRTSYGSEVAVLGGLLAAAIALRGKEGTASEGWTSGLKGGAMIMTIAAVCTIVIAIPTGSSP